MTIKATDLTEEEREGAAMAAEQWVLAHRGQSEGRTIVLVKASSITTRAVSWLLEDRIPRAELTVLAGREGVAKSILSVTYAATLTRGDLKGDFHGLPQNVVICATEDSREHTIVPRLIAAGADLDRVWFVDVTTVEGLETDLTLPTDLIALEHLIVENQIAFLILDPLLSRLAGNLNTHVDAEVRRGLEPLIALIHRTEVSALALIHVNKTSTTDPLTSIMASRAFTAIPRAVLYMVEDPDDPEVRLVGMPKNTLGKVDRTTQSCRVDGVQVGVDADGKEIWAGKLVWTADRGESIRDLLEASATSSDDRSATTEAQDWLRDYLTMKGGSAPSEDCKAEGRKVGHSLTTLKRGRQKIGAWAVSGGFPRTTTWGLPEAHRPVSSPVGPPQNLGPTGPTGEHIVVNPLSPTHAVGSVSPVGPSHSDGPTGSPLTHSNGHARPHAGRSALHWPASLTAHGSDSDN